MKKSIIALLVLLSGFVFKLTATASEYYGNQLNELEHSIYQEFYEQRVNAASTDTLLLHVKSNDIFGEAPDVVHPYIDCSVRRALVAFQNDYPLYATADMRCMWSFEGANIDLTFSSPEMYPNADSDISSCMQEIESIAASVKDKYMDRFLQTLGIVDYMIENYSYCSDDSTRAHSVASLLLNQYGNKGVCTAFSGVFKLVCDKLEIPCIIVLGYYEGEPHSWNLVQMKDNEWYSVDITLAVTHPSSQIDFILNGLTAKDTDPSLLQNDIPSFEVPHTSSKYFFTYMLTFKDYDLYTYDYYSPNYENTHFDIDTLNSFPYSFRQNLELVTNDFIQKSTSGQFSIDLSGHLLTVLHQKQFSSQLYQSDSRESSVLLDIALQSPYLKEDVPYKVSISTLPLIQVKDDVIEYECSHTTMGAPIITNSSSTNYLYRLHDEESQWISDYSLCFPKDTQFPDLPILMDAKLSIIEPSDTFYLETMSEFWYNRIAAVTFEHYSETFSHSEFSFTFPFDSGFYYLYSKDDGKYDILLKQHISTGDRITIQSPTEEILFTTAPLVSNQKIAILIILSGCLSLTISIVILVLVLKRNRCV